MSNRYKNMLYHGINYIFLSDFLYIGLENKTENWEKLNTKRIFLAKIL